MYVRMYTAVNVYIYIHVRLVNERSIGIYELSLQNKSKTDIYSLKIVKLNSKKYTYIRLYIYVCTHSSFINMHI